jgi:unsaturated rhamnogalacturonyl hydrolase
MADSVISRYSPAIAQWHYEHGLILTALEQIWIKTGDAKYRAFVQAVIDAFVDGDGNIRTYRAGEYNLDQINMGKAIFPLYRATGDERYRRALQLLRQQLRDHPRTAAGGFWHKQIYPYQMWLDGVYMAGPFYAEYGQVFDEPANFDDVAHQIILIEERTRDPQTGLLYHAWDERKQQRWADPETGRSPHLWGRALGWYVMAIVDTLDFMPADHPQRPAIIAILERLAAAIGRVQDAASGLWYQVLDQGRRAGNYHEASASCMFVYAIAKGVRRGCLDRSCWPIAERGYAGILRELVAVDQHGLVDLLGTCSVAGLGGEPYRDGSYEYYVGEPTAVNDFKGVGPFILASVEIERAQADRLDQEQRAV